MPKLSEAQKRTLKVMWQYKLYMWVCTWGGQWTVGWFSDADSTFMAVIHTVRRPNPITVRSLEHMDLLKREAEGTFNFRFILTPKGREVAKEEQDAPKVE